MLQFIVNSIIDQIPWWGWALAIASVVGVLLFYFGPVLIPLWRALPLPVRAVLIGIAGLFVAYQGGRHVKGREDEEEQRRREAEALRKRAEVEREVDGLKEGDAAKRLRDRWGAEP